MKYGDILHVRVGGSMGDGMPDYIPTVEDIEATAAQWQELVPEGVKVVVTHHLVEAEVIARDEEVEMDYQSGLYMIEDIPSDRLHSKEWEPEYFDEDGLLTLSEIEYWKKRREEGYGPAVLSSDVTTDLSSHSFSKVPDPRTQSKHYDKFMQEKAK